MAVPLDSSTVQEAAYEGFPAYQLLHAQRHMCVYVCLMWGRWKDSSLLYLPETLHPPHFLLYCLNCVRNQRKMGAFFWIWNSTVLPKSVFFISTLSHRLPHCSKMKTFYNIKKFLSCSLLWWELRRYIMIWIYYIFDNTFTWILHSVNNTSILYSLWNIFGWSHVFNSRWPWHVQKHFSNALVYLCGPVFSTLFWVMIC